MDLNWKEVGAKMIRKEGRGIPSLWDILKGQLFILRPGHRVGNKV